MTYTQFSYQLVRMFVTSSKTCRYDVTFRCKGASMSDNGWRNYFDQDKAFIATEGSVKGQLELKKHFTLKGQPPENKYGL